MGGLERAPPAPPRSPRPGEPGQLLDSTQRPWASNGLRGPGRFSIPRRSAWGSARPASAREAALDAGDGFFGLCAVAEGGQAEVALAARAEAGARGADHVRF